MHAELNPHFQGQNRVHKGSVLVDAGGRFRQRNHARRRLVTVFVGAIPDRQARRVACSGAVRLPENARLALPVLTDSLPPRTNFKAARARYAVQHSPGGWVAHFAVSVCVVAVRRVRVSVAVVAARGALVLLDFDSKSAEFAPGLAGFVLVGADLAFCAASRTRLPKPPRRAVEAVVLVEPLRVHQGVGAISSYRRGTVAVVCVGVYQRLVVRVCAHALRVLSGFAVIAFFRTLGACGAPVAHAGVFKLLSRIALSQGACRVRVLFVARSVAVFVVDAAVRRR